MKISNELFFARERFIKKVYLRIILVIGLIAKGTYSLFASIQGDSGGCVFNFNARERWEFWNGMNAKNYGDPYGIGSLNDKILFQRIVAGVTYKFGNRTLLAAHIQDSRAFGWSLRNAKYPELFRLKKKNTQEPYYTMNPNEEFFEIYDLYLQVDKMVKNIALKVGRQKISFGDNRLFGPGEWGNTGRWTWDAVRLSYKKGKNTLDVFGGGTKIHNPEKLSIPFTQTEHWGGGAYAHLSLLPSLAIEPFYAIKTQGSADYIRTLNFTHHWIGNRVFRTSNNNPFLYDFTLCYEWGQDNSKTISAYGVTALLGYRFSDLPARPILGIRETYASGGSNNDEHIHTFDPAYGAKDSYYGRMNITSWSNLDDKELVVYLSPFKEMKLEINYHWFYVPEPSDAILLSTLQLQPGKHHLGSEFNIYSSYSPWKYFQLVGVFGYFWAGDVQTIQGNPAKNANWFALQASYNLDEVLMDKHKKIK